MDIDIQETLFNLEPNIDVLEINPQPDSLDLEMSVDEMSVDVEVEELNVDGGFIDGYTETDPTVPQHVKGITKEDIEKWNNSGSGNNEIPETLYALGADYAEYFEWEDGNPNNEDRTSLFVSIVYGTRKIRKAMVGEDILGITSIDASVIGNARYKDENTYSAVGMTGVMKVKDNGSCKVGDYVVPGDNGLAIPSTNDAGYKVTARYSKNLIEVLMAHDAEILNRIKTDVENIIKDKADKKEIPDTSEFIKNTVDNLVNYYKKSEVYNKEEINELASTLQNVSITIVDTLPSKGQTNVIYFVSKTGSDNDIYDEWIYVNNAWEHIGSTEVDLTGYATEKWVKDQEYMSIPDFMEYINYMYYDIDEIDEMFDNHYTKEEIDEAFKSLPTGGTELTSGDNTVIEDKVINVYTNTGYKVIDKDIQLQTITDSATSGTNKMVYIDGKEIMILYDGTNKIRRSENGIDFEVVTLPCVCNHMAYNADAERLYGTNSSNYFIYSDDYGLTWKTISNSRASGVTQIAIGYGSGFRAYYRTTKEIINWSFNSTNNSVSQSSRITSTIVPEFTSMVNDTQFIWCNTTGTFKYGAGSQEGPFASLSGVSINLLKRVNNITMLGLKNNNKMYLLEPATSITKYTWIEHQLPATCTLNDIIYNPYDETYYLFTDKNTYYKTKDLTNVDSFESVDKNNLRGIQGYFTLMGIQMTTSNHNELFLAPTRTKLENKLQEHDRDLNKSLWVGKGLELTEEDKVNVKINSDALGVSEYGLFLMQITEWNLQESMIEGIYVAKAEEKGLFDPYELENWYYSEEAYPTESYKVVKFIFTQDGSFYDQVTWETEYYVEKYEYGYLFYDQNMNIFKYVKLGNLSWLLDLIIK